LSVLELHVPRLRERVGDIGRVVRSVLEWATPPKATPPTIDSTFLETAATHSWPGNVRELRDVLAGAVVSGVGTITRDHLPYELKLRAGMVANLPAASLKLAPILEAVEKRLIVLALRKAGGNATKAADLLGIWRARLLRRVEALGIKSEEN
jgi:transcriptional regulator with PAS, ATPase and Fis domain